MIWQQDIQDAIFKHIAEQMKCSVDELHSGETNFIMDETVSKRYVKILSVGDTNVVTVSKNIYSEAMRCLRGKNRDELYESDFVFGQTLHYVPDLSQMTILPYTNDFTFELLVSDEIQKLRGIHGFDNSLSFDEDGNTTTCIVLYAKRNDEIVALVGGIPFSIVLPKAANSVNADMMSVTQIHQKLEKGYADIEKGNVEDAASAFVAFRERH